MGAKFVKLFCDSQLVVNQTNGDAKAKSKQIQKYCTLVSEIKAGFSAVEFVQVCRDQNQKADALARLASEPDDQLAPRIPVEHLQQPSIVEGKPSEVGMIQVNAVWTEPIVIYLRDNELPIDRKEARKVKYRSARYLPRSGVLYKWGYTYPYLRCVFDVEGQYTLREIHEGICGNHLGGRALIFKVL